MDMEMLEQIAKMLDEQTKQIALKIEMDVTNRISEFLEIPTEEA